MLRLVSVLLCLWVGKALADQCRYDFNQDGRCDSYSITPVDGVEGMSAVTIDLGGGRVFTGAFNMGYAGLAAGYLSGEIIIPIDYYSAYDSVKSTYTFRWSEELQNLILKKYQAGLSHIRLRTMPSIINKYLLKLAFREILKSRG